MICLKIRTFVVATTTDKDLRIKSKSCDLLENTYLCGSNNNNYPVKEYQRLVVICLKIRTFVVATTTPKSISPIRSSCDLLENTYLCGSNNNTCSCRASAMWVVICLKIRTFVVATTTHYMQGFGYQNDIALLEEK